MISFGKHACFSLMIALVLPGCDSSVEHDAPSFIARAEKELLDRAQFSAHANWMAANFISHDSQYLESRANSEYALAAVRYATQAAAYDPLQLDDSTRRKLNMLKLARNMPAPNDAEKAARLAEIAAQLQAMYGEGKYCIQARCYSLQEVTKIFASSRDEALLRELWAGWRAVSPPMRALYQEQIALANAGARELGYSDVGEIWRSRFDMSAEEFSADLDKQWLKVKPLYEALHCHARAKLNEHYGDKIVPPAGKIPAHLTGNMWAQNWTNIYDLLRPDEAPRGVDLTQLILQSGMSEIDMVKTGERFFISLGFAALPESFYQRSLFVKPRDREVVCHASAWNLDYREDLRIKMCIEKTAEDFQTIHHELGHNFYQRAYNSQPFIFRDSANEGFHEALGDTISLSITPSYLVQIGLLDKEPPADQDLGMLLMQALDKVAFLPFGLLVDKWRWQVFSGELPAEHYNSGWWQLREKYQGVQAPLERSEKDFDPGAKYHIPANATYAAYFLAFIQQFQFHRALCDVAGFSGPLHRCSIYNNKVAGEKLQEMMALGASKPWPDAMAVLTGQRELDATALLDYFAPLKVWLDEQNKNRQCGW